MPLLKHQAQEQFLLPPISLQILVENSIKHNEFSALSPLQIDISLQQQTLIVSNVIRKKVLRKASSKTGLRNLTERYKLTTEQQLSVAEDDGKFIVQLPLLKIN